MPAHSRDYYRHHRQRARRRPAVRQLVRRGWLEAIIFADTHPMCSCYMCGNPRRRAGEATLQERRLRDRERDEEEETLCALR